MDYTARRNGGGVFEGLYKLIMRRNSIYVTFVIAGAFAGERAVDYGVRKLWEHNNVGQKVQDSIDLLDEESHLQGPVSPELMPVHVQAASLVNLWDSPVGGWSFQL
ncbi:hypothetical protein D5086_009258 [Populus alba]|uniref:Uncharacterized protein n=1 Tax=Populus alba TaxID=43335 RepID=A0ACC4CJD3_POPAL